MRLKSVRTIDVSKGEPIPYSAGDEGNVVPFRRPRRGGSRGGFRFTRPSWLQPWIWQTVTGWLIVANVTIWLVMVGSSLGYGLLSPFPPSFTLLWGSMFPPYVPQEPWRLLTATFVHANAVHVAMNMLILWILGPRLESAYGKGRFLLVYLGAGLTGTIASYLWNSLAGGGSSVGASGAVFGVLGALFVRAYKLVGWGHPVTKQWGFWTIGVLIMGLMLGAGMSGGPIDNAGHIGGWLGGAGISLSFLGRAPITGTRERAVLAAGAAAVVAGFVLSLSLGRSDYEAVPEAATVPSELRPSVAALESGDWEQAEVELSKAIEADPRNARLRLARAEALERLGRKEEAREDLLRAYETARRAEDLGLVALGLARHGEYETARKAAARARQLDPGNPDWKKLYDELKARSGR